MAFFDNLSKKATETTAKAVQKAQEISEITKLNAQISEEERRVNQAYLQIGQKFVALYGKDCDSEFVELAGIVLDGGEKIKDYRGQIQALKGTQKCEKCGAEIARGVAFCSSCGAPVPKVEVFVLADGVKCEKCGAMVKKGMKFCTSCGNPMPPEKEETDGGASEPEVVAKKEKLCENCGAVLEDGAAFCTECGMKM